MKSELRISLCGLFLLANLLFCHAHDNVTMHPLISDSAARSSSGLPNFLAECFGYSDLGQTNLFYSDPDGAKGGRSPLEWIKAGSQYEDVPWIRGINHFYDPTKKPAIGLTDGVNLGGQPSFIWATVETNAFWWQHSYTWLKARSFELNALTNSCKSGRETNLAAMLFYLGHVIHLSQDLSVPAHVRNDNHGFNAANGPFAALVMWTEKFGKDTYSKETNSGFPKEPHGWSWWQNTAGFQKLENFWNRDLLRIYGANALNSDAQTNNSVPLGLSEFCNGNFISEHAPYGEFFTDQSAKHWFQYPSLTNTTEPQLKAGHLAESVGTITLKNLKQGNRAYIRKTGAGIAVIHHSALNYLAVKESPKLGNSQMQVTLTLNDSNVLQEYHSILIPKAIEYSAGILDYFFRGTMDVSLGFDTNSDPYLYTVTNLNTSGQDFGSGTYSIYAEDANGVRTLVQQTNMSTILANNDSMTMTFSGPLPSGVKLFSVYQGTIGITNGTQPLDPVDSNNAIAVSRAWAEQIMTYDNYQPLQGYGGDIPPGGTLATNLQSDDFGFTPTPGNYEVIINGGEFDDTGTIGGITTTVFTPPCGWPATFANTPIIIPASAVSVVGNRLQVDISATDDCITQIGWQNVSITWRAFPVPP